MAWAKNKQRQQAQGAPTAPVRTPPTAIHFHEDEDMSDGEAEAIRALKAEYAAKRAAQKAAPLSTSRSLGTLSKYQLLMMCSRISWTTKS